ncbi:MAG: hypothetical protein AAGK97_04025, partial [Bacteroidota bacterium]
NDGLRLSSKDGGSIIGLEAKGIIPTHQNRSINTLSENSENRKINMEDKLKHLDPFEFFPMPAKDYINIKSRFPLDSFAALREVYIHNLNGVLLFKMENLNHYEYTLSLNGINRAKQSRCLIITCIDARGDIQRKLITMFN